MKFTLITATYNSAFSLRTCLDSVVNQDYGNIEYIIIDGNSSDNTLDIINEYQQDYSYISLISEPDKGIYDALNKGIKISSGEFIGFIHSDDLLSNNKIISNLANNILRDKLDGIYGDLQYVKRLDVSKVVRLWKSCHFNPKLLRHGWMPPHPTLFLSRNVYEKHGLFDISYIISADYDFILRVFSDSELKFGYYPFVVSKMRIGGVSNKSPKNIIRKSKEDLRAIRNNSTGNFLTLFYKNISKVKQFLFH